MKKLIGTTTDFLLKPGREQLGDDVIQWKMKLDFYLTELSFFKKILDKKFLKLVNSNDLKQIEKLNIEIEDTKKNQLKPLSLAVKEYEAMLLKVMERIGASDLEERADTIYKNLQRDIINFESQYHVTKKKIFKLTEKSLTLSNKLKGKVKAGLVDL